MRAADVAGFVGGAALGGLTAWCVRRLPGRAAAVGLGAGLVTAAAIYPLARRPLGADRAELATLAGSAAVAAVGSAAGPAGRGVVAAGWAAHALFDAAHGVRGDSRLPAWYPPMCAGYDLALAAVLLAGQGGRP